MYHKFLRRWVNLLFFVADRDWIWKSKEQTWGQLRKYLAFEQTIHLPMLSDSVQNFRFSMSESEAAQQRDDVLVTLIVYAIFEKECSAKRLVVKTSGQPWIINIKRYLVAEMGQNDRNNEGKVWCTLRRHKSVKARYSSIYQTKRFALDSLMRVKKTSCIFINNFGALKIFPFLQINAISF